MTRATAVRLGRAPSIDGKWEKAQWRAVHPALLLHHMGSSPEHFPKVEVKIADDDDALYVIFRTEDRYVRAVAAADQEKVCRDSCVEFFFTPGPDIELGYFNLEMNCGGALLFHFRKKPGQDHAAISNVDCARIMRAHSLPKIVEPEIDRDVTWTVEYSLPFDILRNYCDVTAPGAGVEWRVNFYKCADATSHPHWLTWAPVDWDGPNFHLPQFFGQLAFE